MTRILIFGSRDWVDSDALADAVMDWLHDDFERNRPDVSWPEYRDQVVIVHGACPTGADAFAEEFAEIKGFKTERHPADWGKHGKAAGPIRNREMAAADADVGIGGWDGKSPGTKNMICEAVMHGIPVRIVPKVKR